MTEIFFEPFGGVAGDMLLGALLDLESERFTLEDLRALAAAIVPGECSIDVRTAWHGSLSGTQVSVETRESKAPPHRGLADCAAIIESSPMPARAKQRALAVFRRIAIAEAHVHGCSIDEIHFHEVGAVDALVDICGACFALERLEVERGFASPPLAGSGTVRCAHGEMPVPAPATAEILRGLALELGGGPGERTTPTGAALLAEFAAPFELPSSFTASAIGYGAGHKSFASGPPNIIRVQLGRSVAESSRAIAWLLEVNLDDTSAEEIGFLVARLRDAGALEVWSSSVQMKKDRPGTIVAALCREDRRGLLEEALFEHSSSLGCRWTRAERTELPRESFEIELDGAKVRIKRRVRAAEVAALDLSPEFDDLVALAERTNQSLRELERRAIEAALARRPR